MVPVQSETRKPTPAPRDPQGHHDDVGLAWSTTLATPAHGVSSDGHDPPRSHFPASTWGGPPYTRYLNFDAERSRMIMPAASTEVVSSFHRSPVPARTGPSDQDKSSTRLEIFAPFKRPFARKRMRRCEALTPRAAGRERPLHIGGRPTRNDVNTTGKTGQETRTG